jgi:hypothetical protein
MNFWLIILCILENGETGEGMVEGNNTGRMDLFSKDIGRMIMRKGVGGLFIQLVIFMKEIGLKIKPKGR